MYCRKLCLTFHTAGTRSVIDLRKFNAKYLLTCIRIYIYIHIYIYI